ncbi:MAG: hypothetical protein Q8R86_12750 [Sulfuricurvum sp.]|nr:hypothetical protein [Sulfuricurvum sp.]
MDTVDHPVERPLRKRYILTMIALILIMLLSIGYAVLFTSFGNRLLAPLVQNQLSSALEHPITLKTFTLTPNRFEISLIDEVENSVNSKGSYTLFPPKINARYDANLSTLKGINTTKLPIDLNGTIKGAYHRLSLFGTSHIFKGQIDYNTSFRFFSLSAAQLVIHNVPYQPFMDTFEYPHDSDTILNGEIQLSGIDKRDINATGRLIATTHRFNPSLLKEDNESFDFWSLFADKNGKIKPFIINATLNTSIDELGILEQFATYPLRTKATLNASLHGSQQELRLDATAYAAKGKADATVTLYRLRPKYLHLEVKHADALSLFKLLSLPSPITGEINGRVNSDFTEGTIALEIQKAMTIPSVLKEHYGITQPLIAFDSSVKVVIKQKLIHTSGTFTSNLEDIPFEATPTHDQMLRELLRQINQNAGKGKI